MSEIRFERAKKGYSMEQVDSYVTMLNGHYKELEEKTEEYKEILKGLEGQSAQKKKEYLMAQKRIDDRRSHLESLKKDLEMREKETADLKEQSIKRNKEIKNVNDKISEMEEEQKELASLPQEPSDRVD